MRFDNSNSDHADDVNDEIISDLDPDLDLDLESDLDDDASMNMNENYASDESATMGRVNEDIARARDQNRMPPPIPIRKTSMVETKTTTVRSDKMYDTNAGGDTISISSGFLDHNLNCNRKERNTKWLKMYNQLVFYRMTHNRSMSVPRRSAKFKKLANWIRFQRRRYSMVKLSEEKIEILESLDFQWRLVQPNAWIEMYDRLVAYKTKHGTTRVLQYWKADPKLGLWVHNQRHRCKDPDRIKLLNDIDFIWKVQKS